ncbi:tumor necrosis factor receptor superfamily member 10B-like isoform X2 [Hemicordylus capensis]|uniref:tumor necrosis factor receptor superfamily member 10B-like isoform X2 n=1 Tax=Hemicordylus capensis TaxID=884348 RepID=UPI0023030701|nr:tumor necrosis factor receptor superfamily member 10B-like isoform X2 [Hemicordylus capensis]
MSPGAKLVLCLSLVFLCVAKTASLPVIQHSEDAPPVTSELQDEMKQFYEHGGLSCKKCSPGHHVSVHCTRSGKVGICHPCPENTFSEHMNDRESCFGCASCRPLDQVELKSCTKTSNTQCACKNGTFCHLDSPCETCYKCTDRCPKGEQVVQPCTSRSDLKCAKPPTNPSTTASTPVPGFKRSNTVRMVAIGVPLVVVLLVFFLSWKCRRTCRGKCILPSRTTDYTKEPLPRRRKLTPATEGSPTEILRRSFQTFVTEVPVPMWERYARALGLTDNEIDSIKVNERDVNEQHFQMLRTWLDHNGKQATLDTLLETLCDPNIKLWGPRGEIEKLLISRGLYAEED